MRWDIFCQVIDNHGDAGVCWRLAAELAARGDAVRLWIDDPAPLRWMAPAGAAGVDVVHWTADAPDLEPSDVVVEAFGCDPPPAFVARMAAATRGRGMQPAWINLEYLSAEPYVERSHGLPSPVSQGPGAGLVKHFFYPGFTARTGGLLREADFAARRHAFDRAAWRRSHGVPADAPLVASLFCYEPPALPQLLRHLAAQPSHLLVTTGRATAATQAALRALDTADADWNAAGHLQLHWLPLLPQREFDALLWSCDLNFVRGEDSLVRGLLAGVPAVWQIYPQDDDAHFAKLEAFLDWLRPPAPLRDFYRAWNARTVLPLPPADPAGWREAAQAAAARIESLPELAAALRQFVSGRGRI